jgi:hypothetical protein
MQKSNMEEFYWCAGLDSDYRRWLILLRQTTNVPVADTDELRSAFDQGSPTEDVRADIEAGRSVLFRGRLLSTVPSIEPLGPLIR